MASGCLALGAGCKRKMQKEKCPPPVDTPALQLQIKSNLFAGLAGFLVRGVKEKFK
jgi:hypothetical protein